MQQSQRRQVLDALNAEAVQRGIAFGGLRTTLYWDRDPEGRPNGWVYLVAVMGGFDSPKTVGLVAVPPVHASLCVGADDLQPSERTAFETGSLPIAFPHGAGPLFPVDAPREIAWRPTDAMASKEPWRRLILGDVEGGRVAVG